MEGGDTLLRFKDASGLEGILRNNSKGEITRFTYRKKDKGNNTVQFVEITFGQSPKLIIGEKAGDGSVVLEEYDNLDGKSYVGKEDTFARIRKLVPLSTKAGSPYKFVQTEVTYTAKMPGEAGSATSGLVAASKATVLFWRQD